MTANVTAAKRVLEGLRSIPRPQCRKQSEEFAVVRFEAELSALEALVLLGESESDRLAALVQARHVLGEAGRLFVQFGSTSASQAVAALAESFSADLDVSETVSSTVGLV